MSITVVQGTSAPGLMATPVTLTFGSATTAGNTIIVFGVNDDGPSVFNAPTGMSNGDVFKTIWANHDTGTGNGLGCWISNPIIGGQTALSIVTNTFDYFAFTAYEVSGLAPNFSFDVMSAYLRAFQTANPCTTNSITTAFPNELLIGFYFDNNSTPPATWTVGSGWSNLENAAGTNFAALATQCQVVSSTGSYSSSITDNATTPDALGFIFGFSDTSTRRRVNTQPYPLDGIISNDPIRPHAFSPGLAR